MNGERGGEEKVKFEAREMRSYKVGAVQAGHAGVNAHTLLGMRT